MPKIGLALQTVSSIGLETKKHLGFFWECFSGNVFLCANGNSLGSVSARGHKLCLVFGCLSCVSLGSGTLLKPDNKEGFQIFQILPVFTKLGRFLCSLSCRAQHSCSGHRCGQGQPELLLLKMEFWGGWLCCASSPPDVTD